MRALVIGGTGTVGSLVLGGLLQRGASVRVLTRSVEKQRALQRGAEGVVGDLERRSGLPPIFEGVDAVFLATMVGPHETDHGLNAIAAARAAGVRRLVYLSIFDLEAGPQVPHFASKVPIERELAAAGLESTVLRANLFFQNDAWLRDAIATQGVYPSPIGNVGVSSVDVRDIADAAVNVMLAPDPGSRRVPVAGPRPWTGTEVAALYAQRLRQPVRYAGDDLDAWGQQARTMLPAKSVADLRQMYALFQQKGLRASAADVALAETVVGHKMRTLEAYVAELIADWQD